MRLQLKLLAIVAVLHFVADTKADDFKREIFDDDRVCFRYSTANRLPAGT